MKEYNPRIASQGGNMSSGSGSGSGANSKTKPQNVKPKPLFRPAEDDTKPALQDPILRSDPTQTEEAVLRLPPINSPSSQ